MSVLKLQYRVVRSARGIASCKELVQCHLSKLIFLVASLLVKLFACAVAYFVWLSPLLWDSLHLLSGSGLGLSSAISGRASVGWRGWF